MGKYEPLTQFLMTRDQSRFRLSFTEIESVLNFSLPKSAYEHDAWWRNNASGHSHARSWLEVGWKTEDLDLAGQKVTFVRAHISAPEVLKKRKRDPWGCMAGTVTILPGTDLTAPSDDEWNAEKGLLLNE